tara:strand:- start:753 stop:2204 length:1452 start_codon:yes stop_codon:yes gene_type:complete
MTTKGDLVRYNTARERLGIGSANQILQVKSSLPSWETVPLADTVLTTQGDILYQDAAGLQRLAASTSGFLLTTKGAGANPVWAASAGGSVATDILVQENNTTIGDYSTPSGSTCSSQAATSLSPDWTWDGTATGWTLGTGCSIAASTLSITNRSDGVTESRMATRDLSSDLSVSTIGNTWVMRFKMTGTSLTNNNSGQAWSCQATIADNNSYTAESPANSGVFAGNFQLALHGAGSTGNRYCQAWTNSSTQTTTGSTFSNPITLTWYVEMTNNGTQIVVKVYSDSGFSSLIESLTVAQSDPTDLQSSLKYLNFRIYVQAITTASTVNISEINFWNNQTAVVAYNNPCSNAIDDNTATYWKSASETNPNIYIDMGSAAIDSNIAIYPHSDTTEAEVIIQSSTDATNWTTRRTILTTNWTNGAWNYIRFNNVNSQYWRIYGNDVGAAVLAISEIKVKSETDADILDKHGHLSISTSDTSLNNAGT